MLSTGISESGDDKCNREGCQNRAVQCFLMWGESFNWRFDLCKHHADLFRHNSDEGYTGIEDKISYPVERSV